MSATHVLGTDQLDRWREFYDRAGSPGVYHHPDYLSLLAGYFEHDTEWAEAFVLEDGDDLAYYPYIRRPLSTAPFAAETDEDVSAYSDVVSSWYWGGPFLSPGADRSLASEFADAFGEYCAETGIVSEFVRFDPNRRNHEDFDVLDPEFNRETVVVDLTKSRDKLWDEFEKRNRNAVRQAQESDLVVEETADEADYRAFRDIYANAMEAKDASDHYRFPYAFFERLFAEEFSKLFVARYEGDVVGGSLVVHDDAIAHDYLRASNPDYWDMRVNNLLCYEALMGMRSKGCERFDFQGGRPGVFKFKKSFSTEGREEFYIGRRVHLPEVYGTLLDAAERAGIDTDTDYFPAYRVELSI